MPVPHRPARRPVPEPDEAVLQLAPPPTRPARGPGWVLGVLPGVGMLPVLALGARGSGTLVLLLVVPAVVGTVGLVVGQRRRARLDHARTVARWHAHVDDLARRCEAAAEVQRLGLDRRHPADLGAAVAAGWAFERHPSDTDALVVAAGSGPVPARVRLDLPPVGPLDDVDPGLLDVARRAVERATTLPAAPVAVDLRAVGLLAVVGDPTVVDRLVAEVAVLHAPGEVAIAGDDRWPHRDGELRVTVVRSYAPGGPAVPTPAIVGCARPEDVPASAGAVLDVASRTLRRGSDVVRLDDIERLGPPAARAISSLLRRRAPLPAPPTLAALLTEPAGELEAPIGLDPEGGVVRLRLAEAAAGGHGPHGLLVGATGSGKSVLLRTVVTGLAARHGPDRLALLLVDFKGGAAFADLADLPHVAGLVTNLAEEPGLPDRMAVALGAELDHRQRVLRANGTATLREAPGALPSLVVVVDEAGELLAAVPGVADVLARIGRVGRSLGVHLLLSTQSWDAGRLHALDAHLRYRICLRTVGADDSRAVLGTDAAMRLPARSGAAWLAVDGTLRRVDILPPPDPPTSVVPPRSERAGAVWLPPLPAALPWPGDGSIGRLDVPAARAQPPLVADGHVAVAGGPRSGVSTALRAIVQAADAEVHVLDAGGSLRDLAALPHVGTVAGPHEPQLVRAVVGAVRAELARRVAGGDGPPLLLVVDGVAGLRSDDGALESGLSDVAARGLGVGVRLAVGCRRWSELRAGLFDATRTKIELRLGDPSESVVGRARAASVPDVAGRGLLPDGTACQIALPDGLARSTRRTGAVRLLPTTVVEPHAQGDGAFLLGVGGGACTPVALDVTAPGSHLVVAGDAGSGRTTVLRRLVAHLAATADVHVVDPRRALLVAAASWQHDPAAAAAQMTDLVAGLRRHLPEPGASPAEIACRTNIPERNTYVLIDDVDLLADHPLASAALADLATLLPYAQETGLHVVVARPASTHTFDPLAARLRAAGPWVLQLPGEHLDGPGAGRGGPTLPGRGLLARGRGPAIEVQCYRPASLPAG